MRRSELPPHYVGTALVATGVIVVAILLNVSLMASDPVARYEAARAALQLSDALLFVVTGGLLLGIGVGFVLGGLQAFHEEVSDR